MSDPTGELVTVLESPDPLLIGLAASLLDDAGIAHCQRGGGLQDAFLFGKGRNPFGRPIALAVDRADEEDARALLAELAVPPED